MRFSRLKLCMVFLASLPFHLTAMAQETILIGTWKGTITQDSSAYSTIIKIERLELNGYAGTTTYSGSANCTGLLTFRRQRAGLYEFDETINSEGNCVNGRMELYITKDGKLQLEWRRKGNCREPDAEGTFSQVPPPAGLGAEAKSRTGARGSVSAVSAGPL